LDATLLPQREFATAEFVAWLRENACTVTTEVIDRRSDMREIVASHSP
jgi:hypothetical protein